LTALKAIERHFATFQTLVATANDYLSRRRFDAAAVYAEIAASYATEIHAGLYASHQLEQVLLTIGQRVSERTQISPKVGRTTSGRRRVIHVLTEARGVGGSTRMVWRWIEQDAESTHFVVLTRQLALEVPSLLRNAVKETGGRVLHLNQRPGNLLTWAQKLRSMAASADLVVLHIHNHDVIPLIAFADKRGMPPIVFLNHSDHKFWVGAGVSDVVANQRWSGSRLTQARRGIPESQCGILPIVLEPSRRTFTVAAAKAEIGLSPDTILLLSIARAFKYSSLGGRWSRVNDLVLPEAALPVLREYPNVSLLVIGPDHQDRWVRAAEIVQGRIRALGEREDTSIYYQAADVYVDSFPLASITSCLEAGSFGTPVVSCRPFSEDADVLGADTPALDEVILRVADSSEFSSVVCRLVQDSEYRTRIGTATQRAVEAVHTGEGWRMYLRALYAQAERMAKAPRFVYPEDQPMMSELDALRLEVDSAAYAEDTIIQWRVRSLPIDLRVKLWAQMRKHRSSWKPGLLLPEWLAVDLIKTRARIASLSNRFPH
jgi:glycosyltransferase involved in cell wall biosynthesis